MGQNYYISDLHFGHTNIIRFDNRPWYTIEEMDKSLIDNWNSVVTDADTVYCLGDFCWQTENRWIEILDQLNGNKQLIKGNHCIKSPSAKLKKKFQDIKDYKEITDDGRHVIMSHYPIMCYKASYDDKTWMLHGHTHTTREQDFVEKWTQELVASKVNRSDSYGHIINCGCMMPWMDYKPRTLDELIAAWESKYNTK